MTKYLLEYLDDKMVFDQVLFQRLSSSIPFSCRLKRIDDFELSMEVESIQEASILPLHDVLHAMMSVFAAQFWNAETHHFIEMHLTDILFSLRLPVSIDIILTKSSSSEIEAEFYFYQGLVDLCDAELKIHSV
ncbi:hypothetical protein [Dyadobacter sp. CY356]|uniref:hypothetical protein n=1 Tax=Dyadobacter sp. CY356 TaxID=2906442 RepID=UPI001F232384|nr:hypothetical protein [Dyadobacter sp. CY356]MCF0057179.1 hypothetical protein [Dyadobacter sp. CY356]